ncbi:MAG: J domain-containing protein [Synechococcaceae cyanobacterium SM2_3_1]|nr:J domain-containing protein [Synechococcaceae cyanobacterium SM2_3_1]
MGSNSELPTINQGLARYESDYYAILGAPISAEAKQISDSYKQVCKALRVGFVGRSEEADRATRLIAKVINPAKEILCKDKERIEYDAVLKIRVERLLQQKPLAELWPNSEKVSRLRRSPQWRTEYAELIHQLAKEQYASLDQVAEMTIQLSELNLAYLLLRETGQAEQASSSSTISTSTPSTDPQPNTVAEAVPKPPVVSPEEAARLDADKRFKQGQQMIDNKQYREAVQFLTIAINKSPLEASFYALRGIAQLRQGNRTMAKEDLQHAYRIDPTNEEAKQGMKEEAQTRGLDDPTAPPARTPQPQKIASKGKATKEGGGGLLGRLFKRN